MEENNEIKRIRSIKLTDKVWNRITASKKRKDMSWDLYFDELMNLIEDAEKILEKIKNL